MEKSKPISKTIKASKSSKLVPMKSGPIDVTGLNKVSLDAVATMNYAAILAPEENKLDLTEEEQQFIEKKLNRLAYGFRTSGIFTCPGASECPRAVICPFAEKGKEPEGSPCPVESDLLYKKTLHYASHYGVADGDIVKLEICQEIAECDLLEWRVTAHLSTVEGQGMTEEKAIGYDEENQSVITSKDISDAFKIKDSIKRTRLKLHSVMIGTPEAKIKAEAITKKSDDLTTAASFSQLRAALQEIERSQQSKRVIDVNFTEE